MHEENISQSVNTIVGHINPKWKHENLNQHNSYMDRFYNVNKAILIL